MNIHLVTPAPEGSRTGNRTTAERWRDHLVALGHQVALSVAWSGEPADLLVALHAARSGDSIRAWRAAHPRAPLVIGLAGTDVYGDIHRDPDAAAALALADRLVLLQPLAAAQLPAAVRARARTIRQSALPPPQRRPPRADVFEVCAVSHLREVKDPLLAAAAVRRLPPASPVRIIHAGGALDPALAALARAESEANPRWQWRGEVDRDQALALIASSRLLLLTSRSEGGANVVSEAIACGTPVLSTRIDGSIGILGADYPGYFAVGDAAALAELLGRAASDAGFLADLAARIRALAPLVDPANEREAWRALLAELSVL